MSYTFWRNTAIAAGVLASVGISGMVFASQNPTVTNGVRNSLNNFHYGHGMMRYTQHENFEALDRAIENGDYQAWKSLVTQNGRHPQIVDKINENNFAKLQEMHQARLDGDVEKANAIRQELGLVNAGFRGRYGNKNKFRSDIREAIENNDYAKWKDLINKNGRHPQIADKINENNFAKLQEMHQARLDGDVEKANAIRQELGLLDRGVYGHSRQGYNRNK